MTKQTWAKLAALLAGLAFGIYWIPIRALEDHGLPGLWAVFTFNFMATLILFPLIIHRWRCLVPGRKKLHAGTFMAGLAFVFYASAFLYTEVVKVFVLFYLLPIWGFIIARIVTGERITTIRWVSMAVALGGLMVIFGWDTGLPMPSNRGDWMALCAGILWAGASMLMLTDEDHAVNYTLGFIFWSALIACVAAVLATSYGSLPGPDWSGFNDLVPYLIVLSIVLIIPTGFASMFGPSQLNSGTVGLLFMTEISMGTITAAIFAGEPFGAKEVVGVGAITLAGILEPIRDKWFSQNTPTR